MSSSKIQVGSLVLYKNRAAVITALADKIDIALQDGKSKRVRDKDFVLLHPGPVAGWPRLDAPSGNLEEALELLAGEAPALPEVAELVFGEFSPATAWATWELLADGLYFEGTPEQIRVRSEEQVAAEQAERAAREAERLAWERLVAHIEAAELDQSDRDQLGEVERVALGQSQVSRILDRLGFQQTPESAHRFLVNCGYWQQEHNPWPARFGVTLDKPDLPVPALEAEPRRDLTALPAFAIDDEDNEDPDDALSLDGERIWVHVADVAALVQPDSPLDIEARARAANLYLPERIVPMLPWAITEQLGLGLQEVSPALSIGFRIGADGPEQIEITPSLIRVQRLTYGQADRQLESGPLAALMRQAEEYRQRRFAAGALELDFPELSLRVRDGEIRFKPIERGGSRRLVTELMLAAGEAVGRFAQQHELAMPFVSQEAVGEFEYPQTPSDMYACRRRLKPSGSSPQAGRHFALGLDGYTRATSPLRRYLDLVTHQQLRAHLSGRPSLDADAILRRIGATEAPGGAVRRAERQSNLHWKLAWLQRNPGWEGEAIVVALEERKAQVVVPELALETRVRLKPGMTLNQSIRVLVREIDLFTQDNVLQTLL